MTTVRFKADCSIRATADKPATVAIVAYTGSPMRLPGLGLTVVDLAGMALAPIPLLADHDNHLGGIAGSGSPRVEAGKLLVAGTLANGTAAANQILALHKSGVRLQASIGAEVEASTLIDGGRSITANGRTHVAPPGGLTFVSKSRLREVSFVAAGADSQTSVSIAASRKASTMKTAPTFEAWGRDMLGSAFDTLDSDQLANLHANYSGRTDTTPADFTATASYITAAEDPEEMRLRRIERSLQREERIAELEAKFPQAHTVRSSRRYLSPAS